MNSTKQLPNDIIVPQDSLSPKSPRYHANSNSINNLNSEPKQNTNIKIRIDVSNSKRPVIINNNPNSNQTNSDTPKESDSDLPTEIEEHNSEHAPPPKKRGRKKKSREDTPVESSDTNQFPPSKRANTPPQSKGSGSGSAPKSISIKFAKPQQQDKSDMEYFTSLEDLVSASLKPKTSKPSSASKSKSTPVKTKEPKSFQQTFSKLNSLLESAIPQTFELPNFILEDSLVRKYRSKCSLSSILNETESEILPIPAFLEPVAKTSLPTSPKQKEDDIVPKDDQSTLNPLGEIKPEVIVQPISSQSSSNLNTILEPPSTPKPLNKVKAQSTLPSPRSPLARKSKQQAQENLKQLKDDLLKNPLYSPSAKKTESKKKTNDVVSTKKQPLNIPSIPPNPLPVMEPKTSTLPSLVDYHQFMDASKFIRDEARSYAYASTTARGSWTPCLPSRTYSQNTRDLYPPRSFTEPMSTSKSLPITLNSFNDNIQILLNAAQHLENTSSPTHESQPPPISPQAPLPAPVTPEMIELPKHRIEQLQAVEELLQVVDIDKLNAYLEL